MADAILMAGGTGGVTSDDVTAGKAQVLQGYKTVTTDSDDEVVEGTIPDRGVGDTSARMDTQDATNSRVSVDIPEGYYHGNNGHPWVWIGWKNIADILGIDKNKIVSSATYAGVTGAVIDKGNGTPENNTSDEMFYYEPFSGYVVRFEPGAYYMHAQWKPVVKVPVSLVKSAVNYHPEKTLNDTITCNERGTVAIIDTKVNDYSVNASKGWGIDTRRGKFWATLGHGNAYYCREDNSPHVDVPATEFGTAGADSVLQWQTASSQHGIKFQGTIPRWIATHGDVILANPSHSGQGFAYDLPNVGRCIVVGIKNGAFIQGANYVALPSPNFQPWNIRAGVNIHGITGTLQDYGAGRVAFRNATFDGVLISGVANIGLGNNLNVYSKPSTEIRDGIIRFDNGSSVSGGGLHQYRSNSVLEEAVTLAHSVNLTPFRTIRLGLKYPYGGRWGTVGGVGSLVGVLWALPTNITPEYVPSRNAKINPNVIKRVGYKDGVIPATQGQWNTPSEIPAGAEYFVDIDVSDLQGHHRIVLGMAVSEASHNENFTIQVIVYVNNSVSGISHIEFIN